MSKNYAGLPSRTFLSSLLYQISSAAFFAPRKTYCVGSYKCENIDRNRENYQPPPCLIGSRRVKFSCEYKIHQRE